ncbi:hypothetical protein A2U01_0110796, partial [Trifolium medium]|nr:hypothetical protein [Trifolium medium]
MEKPKHINENNQSWETTTAARTVGAEKNRTPKGLHAPHPTV